MVLIDLWKITLSPIYEVDSLVIKKSFYKIGGQSNRVEEVGIKV